MDKPTKKFKNKNPPTPSVTKEHVYIIKPIKNCSDKTGRISDDWNLYLPDKSYDEFKHFNGKLKAIEKCFSKFDDTCLNSFSKNKYFRINVVNILNDKAFLFNWPEFMDDLVNSPNMVIGLFGFAMDQLIKEKIPNFIDYDEKLKNGVIPTKLNPRFVDSQNFMSLQDLKMYHYQKFVTVIGTVVRVTDEKPFSTCMAFMCAKCRNVQVVVQNRGCYTRPNTCNETGCFGRVFKPLLRSRLTQTVPFKSIRLQELYTNNSESGRVPRTVECELTCDLTDSCMPGDTVVISGIVTTSNDVESKATGKDASLYVLQISTNSVVCLKGKNADNVDDAPGCFQFKSEDNDFIKNIHSEGNIFRLVVLSLCPNIYGHELIKAGLVLGLFGGGDTPVKKDEYSIRENSHILIVGDPGLGKSQLLLACANVSPRGVYVCGNSTTSSGLTVTISKESGGGNSLEAGALVLADQGHCCIDEFDKMMHQHSALLEAMEQQTISMAKSGVVCTLPARTSILAAANPSGGHYNKAKTVSENLKIGGSLLSRFDLVFIVQDEPDQDIDSKMSKHVMRLHMHNNCESAKGLTSTCFPLKDDGDICLLEKLKLQPNEKINFIPHATLQKYISYARKISKPRILPKVAKVLQDFYLDMRKQNKLSYTTPITTRQLESLIRLTRVRAKIELRPFCTINDAEEVIEIMKYSMRETFSDEPGNIDFDRSIHGSGMSKSAQAKKLINLMTTVAITKGDDCFTTAEIQQLGTKVKISSDSLDFVIDNLNDQGFILKKGHKLYQLQTL